MYASALTNSTISVHEHNPVTTAIADTAASNHYGPLTAKQSGLKLHHESVDITCANELSMQSVWTILLPIQSESPTSALKLSTFSQMKQILIPIPTIVDADYDVHLTKHFIKIYKDDCVVWEGKRDPISQMWLIKLNKKVQNKTH